MNAGRKTLMNVRRTKLTTTALAVTLLSVIFLLPTAGSGQVIDRIVARVNGSIILQSELDEALSYEALLNGKSFNQFATEERRAVLDRLIDQELLHEQLKSSELPHATEAEAASIRKRPPTRDGKLCSRSLIYGKKTWFRMCRCRSI
jgi:hypothetical protein